MDRDPYDELAADVRRRVDRLINTAEAKFQYCRDIQGDPIKNPDTLTLVVNAHAAVFNELVVTVGVLGRLVEQSLLTQEALLNAVRKLGSNANLVDADINALRNEIQKLTDRV